MCGVALALEELRVAATDMELSLRATLSAQIEGDGSIVLPGKTFADIARLLPADDVSIEHKPAGKYDTESERVAQPAGFAYMAPPGQSNQYGRWENSGGRDFWVFYGQYALMRDLLFNRDYRPLGRYEYEDYYRYRERNQTYYGRDDSNGAAPKYGTQGTATQNRYSGSTFAQKASIAALVTGRASTRKRLPSTRSEGGSAGPR